MPKAGSRQEAEQKSQARQGYEKVFERIYRMVLRIPRGRVMTYGQLARLMDERYSPRLVGWAMHATPRDGREIPWHRVINSKGGVSTGRVIPEQPELQRLLLEAEGVVFDERGKCDLATYQWSPIRRQYRETIKLTRAKRATGPKKSRRQKKGGRN
jgi:methylated-DNA-protein-cysteine methyltransferase-like protein